MCPSYWLRLLLWLSWYRRRLHLLLQLGVRKSALLKLVLGGHRALHHILTRHCTYLEILCVVRLHLRVSLLFLPVMVELLELGLASIRPLFLCYVRPVVEYLLWKGFDGILYSPHR